MSLKIRIISSLMTVCLIAGCITGCNSVDFTEHFAPAYEKTAALDQMDMTIKTDVTYSSGSNVRVINMTFGIKELLSEGKATKSELDLNLNTKVLGSTIDYNSRSYIAGGYIYTDEDGVLTKQSESDSNGINIGYFKFENIVPNFDAVTISSSKAKKKKGEIVSTFSFNGELMRDTVSALLKTMYESLGETNYDVTQNARLTDATANMTVNADGYISGYTFKIKAAYDNASNSKTSVTIDMAVSINNPGGNVTVTDPDNLNIYLTKEMLADAYVEFAALKNPETGERVSDYDSRVAALREKYGSDFTDYFMAKNNW